MNSKIERLVEQIKDTKPILIELDWDGDEGRQNQELWLCGDQLNLCVYCYKRVKTTAATYLQPEESEVMEKSATVLWDSIQIFFIDEDEKYTPDNEESYAIEQALLDIITY